MELTHENPPNSRCCSAVKVLWGGVPTGQTCPPSNNFVERRCSRMDRCQCRPLPREFRIKVSRIRISALSIRQMERHQIAIRPPQYEVKGLTVSGKNGGTTRLFSMSSQLTSLKNGWRLISSASSGPAPNRLAGSRVNSYAEHHSSRPCLIRSLAPSQTSRGLNSPWSRWRQNPWACEQDKEVRPRRWRRRFRLRRLL